MNYSELIKDNSVSPANRTGIFPYGISYEYLPNLFQNQIKKLGELQEKIEASNQKILESKESIKAVKTKITFWGGRKAAIEELQKVIPSLAGAIESEQEAVKLLFDNQKQANAISNQLLSIGIMNVAQNRSLVKNLKFQLEHASEEEINEQVKQELFCILEQIKAQEDLYDKLNTLSQKVDHITDSLKEDISDVRKSVTAISINIKEEIRNCKSSYTKLTQDIKKQQPKMPLYISIIALIISLGGVLLAFLR